MAYTDASSDLQVSQAQQRSLTDQIFSRFNDLKTQRVFYHNMWDDITEFVLPNRGDFAAKRGTAQRKDRRLFDSTAIRANEYLASTLKEGIMPIHELWGRIQSRIPQVNDIDEAKYYFEAVNETIYEVLNNPASNFHAQNHELFLDLCAYGTAIMYVDSAPSGQIRFRTIHLSEIYLAEDIMGTVDTVFREFQMTPRQAAQQWGAEQLSSQLKGFLTNSPDEKVKFMHCVKPNEDYDGVKVGKTNLPFMSYYCEFETRHVLDIGGYHEMPYKVVRWEKFVGELYGRSPAWSAMPDIMMASALKNIIIRASQKAADPIYLLADDGVVLPLDTRPGGVNFGGIDPVSGRPRIQVLENQGRFDVSLQLLETTRKDIRDSFFMDPLRERNTDRMTATAVLELKDEKLSLIGPQVGRIQSEYVGPLLQRVYGILQRNNSLPSVADDLADLVTKYGLEITYSSPLFNTQRRQEPVALQRTLQTIMPLIQMDPRIVQNFDLDAITRSITEVYGAPPSYLKPSEDVQAERQKAEQQQAQLQAQAQQSVEVDNVSKLAKAGIGPSEQ